MEALATVVRDLYDLAWFGQGTLDEPQIRRLMYMKVYMDVVSRGLGSRPFDAGEILRPRGPREFRGEDIGLLVTQTDIPGWVSKVRNRYAFLANPTDEELLWAACDPRDLYDTQQQINTLRPT